MGFPVRIKAIAIAGIGARTAWQAIRAGTVLDQALARVTAAAGMVKLPVTTEAETGRSGSVSRLAQVRSQ